MGATCLVCQSADVDAINATLMGGMSLRKTAAQFGLKYDSVRRHQMNHLTPSVQGANPNGWQPPAGATWKEKMEALAAALEQGKVRSDMAAQLRMVYRELDDAGDGGPVEVAVADVPGLAEAMGDLFLALEKWPQAREAFGVALRKHGLIK